MRRFVTRIVTASLFLVAPLLLLAQRPQQGMGGGAPTTAVLLANKGVQEELKLSEDMVAKITKSGEEMAAKMKDAFKEAGKDKDKMAELRKSMTEESKKLSDKFVADLKPEQVKRLKQIEIQASGLGAFDREDVKTALKLTDKQAEELKALSGEIQKDAAEIRKEAGKDKDKQAEAQKKISELRAKGMAKAAEGLTADQKKAWADLTGAKFTYVPQGFGPRP